MMTYRKSIRAILPAIIPLIAGIILLTGAHSAFSQSLSAIPERKTSHPKIQSMLEQRQQGHREAQAAQGLQPLSASPEMITVFIIAEPGKMADTIDQEALKAYGAEIIKSAGGTLKAKVPIDLISQIADSVKGISFIQLPDKPASQAITSEGVALTKASIFSNQGYTGAGVKVAVIDLGFAGLTNAINNGDLPSSVKFIDCTGTGCVTRIWPWDIAYETEGHGTAVAEIVRDMAPGADLYLIKINDALDLSDAANFCISNGVKIINHSVGWYNTNFYDGKCWLQYQNPVCTVNDAFAHEILWVNAAGNAGNKHHSAIFSSSDGNTFHDPSIFLYAFAGDVIALDLTWEAWPYTDQDYDFWLVDSSFTAVSKSLNVQIGTQKPVESIYYIAPSSGIYYLWVRKWSATTNHKFHIYSRSHILSPSVASSSLLSPSDAAGALTVGAINQQNWSTGAIASYSSQGPTNDGRTKPDITGPDGVATYTYGSSFTGTSAASPHVAGAAALILSRNPTYSAEDLGNALFRWATGAWTVGKGNVFGYGRLSLPCSLDISPQNHLFNSQSITDTLSISESSNSCPWFAASLDSWLTITSGATGTGNGTVGYSVSANTGAPRTGRLMIGDQIFTVMQGDTNYFTQAQLDQAVTDANTAKDALISNMYTKTQLDQAVANANAAKDLIIAEKDQTIAVMFTKAQLDTAVADANAAKDLVIAAMFTKTQLDKAVTDANAAKDLIIASMFTKTQLDKAVTDISAAKDKIIAAMFTQAQLDKVVADEKIKYDPNGDGKIGLVEIIYYLQVLSGARTSQASTP